MSVRRTAFTTILVLGLVACFPDPPAQLSNDTSEKVETTTSPPEDTTPDAIHEMVETTTSPPEDTTPDAVNEMVETTTSPPEDTTPDAVEATSSADSTNDFEIGDDATADSHENEDDANQSDTSHECQIDDDCSPGAAACVRARCQDGVCTTDPLSDAPCNDMDPCTHDDRCILGVCDGEAYECDDGLACTTDQCDGLGGCLVEISQENCLIEGACWSKFQPHPANPCLRCEEGVAWTGLSGTPCDDGVSCTVGDTCVEGTCAAGTNIPDDEDAGDWLSYPAVAWDPNGSVVVTQVAPAYDGLMVLGSFFGRTTFANGIIVDPGELGEHFVARYDFDGTMMSLFTLRGFLGRNEIRLLPLHSRDARVVVDCPMDCELVAQPSGEVWPLPTTPEFPTTTISFYGDVPDVGGPSLLSLEHSLALESDVANIYVGVLTETRTVGERTFEFLGPYRDLLLMHVIQSEARSPSMHHIYLDPAKLPPDPPIQNSPWLKVASVARDTNEDVIALVGANYDLLISHDDPQTAPFRLTATSPSYHLVRIAKGGIVLASTPFMSELEPWVAEQARFEFLVSQDGIFVYGNFRGPSVTVGSGPNLVEHLSTQFFNIYGGGIKGAGGEAFLAKFDHALKFQWVRFVEPIGALPSNERGTDWGTGRLNDDGIVLMGRIQGAAFIFGDLRRVGMIAVYNPTDGAMKSFVPTATSINSMIIFPEWGSQMYIAGTVSRYQGNPDFEENWRIGVGPTSVPWVPPQSAFIQRINSANGLICGALGP